MIPEEIQTLIRKGENETIEFKKSFNSEAIETLVAFANSQGGTVYLGISDNGGILEFNDNG